MFFEKNYINKTIKIGGMSCNHCKARVEKALNDLKSVKSVEVDLENKNAKLVLKQDIDESVLKNAIEEIGFSYEGIE